MTPHPININREGLRQTFACPDASKMLWTRLGDNGYQCHGCKQSCGIGSPESLHDLFPPDPQTEMLFTTPKGKLVDSMPLSEG